MEFLAGTRVSLSKVVRNKGHLHPPPNTNNLQLSRFPCVAEPARRWEACKHVNATRSGNEEGGGCKHPSPVPGAVVKIADDDEKRA